jgi:hypothetical protein
MPRQRQWSIDTWARHLKGVTSVIKQVLLFDKNIKTAADTRNFVEVQTAIGINHNLNEKSSTSLPDIDRFQVVLGFINERSDRFCNALSKMRRASHIDSGSVWSSSCRGEV